MSDVARIQFNNFARTDVLRDAVIQLQAQGVTDIWTDAQYQQAFGIPAISRSMDPASIRKKASEGNINALRHGEPLAIVVNDEYRHGDVAGFTAQASQYGPAGVFTGGVHPGYAEEVTTKKVNQLKLAYGQCMMKDIANRLSEHEGVTVEQVNANYCQIHIGGSNLGGML